MANTDAGGTVGRTKRLGDVDFREVESISEEIAKTLEGRDVLLSSLALSNLLCWAAVELGRSEEDVVALVKVHYRARKRTTEAAEKADKETGR